jgi:hypothetical protein
VAIPADRNVVHKEAEKKLKYKSLCIDIERMWNLKGTIIPVITGANGIVTRSLRKRLEVAPGKHSINSLQKQLYWEHHTQYGKYRSVKFDHLSFKRNTRKKRLVTRHIHIHIE